MAVNGLLANFAVAFTQPTVAVFALLFTGAVLVRGRHTVTRMILAAGVRVRHHARYHRFFSRSRWSMDDLWKGLVRLVAAAFLSKDRPVLLGGDDTAQKKTGAKIYGAGMVHDNRPAARKGWDLAWGLTWVVVTVLVRVPLWPDRVFAIPVGARLYRKKKFCSERKRPSLPDQAAVAPGDGAATGRMAAGLHVLAARGWRIRQRRVDAIAAEECSGRRPDALRRGAV